jgi:anti-sigma-K factor RskA
MDEERLKQKLRDYLKAEVKKVEPSVEWWDDVVSHLGERKPSFWEKYGGWLNRPLWRAVVPLVTVVMVVAVLWGTGVLPGFRGVSNPTQPPGIGGMGGTYPVIVSSVTDDSSGGALVAYRVDESSDSQDIRLL